MSGAGARRQRPRAGAHGHRRRRLRQRRTRTTCTSPTSPTTSTCCTATRAGSSSTTSAIRMGVATPSMPFLGWGTDFIDYDNDGWRDLLVVNGHVYPQADRLPWNSSYAQRALLFRNLQGQRFEEVGAAAGPCADDATRQHAARRSATTTTTVLSTSSSASSTARRCSPGTSAVPRGPLALGAARRRPGPALPARCHWQYGGRHRRRQAAHVARSPAGEGRCRSRTRASTSGSARRRRWRHSRCDGRAERPHLRHRAESTTFVTIDQKSGAVTYATR